MKIDLDGQSLITKHLNRLKLFRIENGVESGRTKITYHTLKTDVSKAVDTCHQNVKNINLNIVLAYFKMSNYIKF